MRNHYAVGWAHALNTPYPWTKQVASHWGGTRNGAVVHSPQGIRAKGEVRTQFHHVIDVAPTILDLAHLPQPESVNGIQKGVLLSIADDPNNSDHLVSPEDAVRAAMGRH